MDLQRIDQIVNKYEREASALIQVLLDIQSEYRWLPKEALWKVSDSLHVPKGHVQRVATFYKAFSLVPKGRNEVHVCMGTACHVRGAKRVLDKVSELIGIGPGETDLQLRFSLETVNCLGCCALGPVMEINGRTHGRLTTANTTGVLESYG